MKVRINVYIDSVSRSRSKAELDLPEGATVGQAIKEFEEKNMIPTSIIRKKGIIIYVNDNIRDINTVLKDMDHINVLGTS
jgi:molybdopterin converting factor small subunit